MKDLIEIARLAGVEILRIYDEDDFGVEFKADESPITLADKAANEIIVAELTKRFTGIPILSEESRILDYETRKTWSECFIVDPIDGTKEFIKRNGEFTVNIAHLKEGKLVNGVIYAPASNQLYFTDSGKAYRQIDGVTLELPCVQTDKFTVVVSNSHINEPTQNIIEELKAKHQDITIKRVGSSLKMCMIAEGSADYYPRLGPTSEWDTAAAQSILEHSGCEMLEWESGEPLIYNKENILNPHFKVQRLNE